MYITLFLELREQDWQWIRQSLSYNGAHIPVGEIPINTSFERKTKIDNLEAQKLQFLFSKIKHNPIKIEQLGFLPDKNDNVLLII